MHARFTDRAQRIMAQAKDEARRLRGSAVDTEHLLLALSFEHGLLERLGLEPQQVRQQVERLLPPGSTTEPSGLPPPFSHSLMQVLAAAQVEVDRRGEGVIGAEHLLLALAEETDGIGARALRNLGVTDLQVRSLLAASPGRPGAPASTTPLRPLLLNQRSKYSWARAYPSLEDRPALQQRILDSLERGRNVALVGPAGVGKTSLILALARAKAGGFGWWMIDGRLFEATSLPDLVQALVPGTVGFVPAAELLPPGEPSLKTRLILEVRDERFPNLAASCPEFTTRYDVLRVEAPGPQERKELLDAACARIRRERGVEISVAHEAAALAIKEWPEVPPPWGAIAVLHRAESIQAEHFGRGDLYQLESDIERLEASNDPGSLQHAAMLKAHVEGLRAMMRKDLSIESVRQAIAEITRERHAR